MKESMILAFLDKFVCFPRNKKNPQMTLMVSKIRSKFQNFTRIYTNQQMLIFRKIQAIALENSVTSTFGFNLM